MLGETAFNMIYYEVALFNNTVEHFESCLANDIGPQLLTRYQFTHVDFTRYFAPESNSLVRRQKLLPVYEMFLKIKPWFHGLCGVV